LENKRNKFQGQELTNELDVNIYEFKWRSHDPQIGRFWQIDPLSDKYRYNSTYAFSENKVVAHRELEGLESWPVNNPDRTTSTFSGPWANRNAAQAAYNDRKRINGERLNIGSDGMVVSDRISRNRVLNAQENGPLTNVIGIVLHTTAGSSASGAISAMQSKNLGVHFIIDKDGTIMQLASLNFWLSHVGAPRHKDGAFRSTNTIGIEHVGEWNEDTQTWEELTEEQIDASAWLVKSLMRNYNIHPYDVRNHEDISYKKPGEGKHIRDVIEAFIYRLDPDQVNRGESNNTPPPLLFPNFY
jgi:RHS repeat-associated protein